MMGIAQPVDAGVVAVGHPSVGPVVHRDFDPQAIVHRRRDLRRENAAMALTASTAQFIAQVFGHWHHRLQQIEHLTPILDQRIGLGAKVRPQRSQCLGRAWRTVTSGLATRLSVVPWCPA